MDENTHTMPPPCLCTLAQNHMLSIHSPPNCQVLKPYLLSLTFLYLLYFHFFPDQPLRSNPPGELWPPLNHLPRGICRHISPPGDCQYAPSPQWVLKKKNGWLIGYWDRWKPHRWMHEGMKVACLSLRQEAWYFLADVAATLSRYKGDLWQWLCCHRKQRCYYHDLKCLKLSQQEAELIPGLRLLCHGTSLSEVPLPSPSFNRMRDTTGDQAQQKKGRCFLGTFACLPSSTYKVVSMSRLCSPIRACSSLDQERVKTSFWKEH